MASQFISGSELGEQLCKLLGVDHKNVYRIVIDVRADSVPVIEVHRYLEAAQANPLVEGLKKLDAAGSLKKAIKFVSTGVPGGPNLMKQDDVAAERQVSAASIAYPTATVDCGVVRTGLVREIVEEMGKEAERKQKELAVEMVRDLPKQPRRGPEFL